MQTVYVYSLTLPFSRMYIMAIVYFYFETIRLFNFIFPFICTKYIMQKKSFLKIMLIHSYWNAFLTFHWTYFKNIHIVYSVMQKMKINLSKHCHFAYMSSKIELGNLELSVMISP